MSYFEHLVECLDYFVCFVDSFFDRFFEHFECFVERFNKSSLAVSPKMEATQMEIFNFLWLTWDH